MNVKKHSSGSRDEVGYVSTVAEFAEDCVARAHMLISSFIEGEEDEHGKKLNKSRLITQLDYIHEDLFDCDEDGWDGYRDAMDSLSNRLWQIGVAWPQSLPCWSNADVVCPNDLNEEISPTCLYREDLLAIREFSDNMKCTFKAAVHMMVDHAQDTLGGFPRKENAKAKQMLRGKKISRRR